MAEFRTYYSPEDVIGLNLLECSERFGKLCEQEIGHLRELAIELANSYVSFSDLLASLSDTTALFSVSSSEDTAECNRETIDKLQGMHRFQQQLLLCIELEKQLSQRGPIRTESFFQDSQAVSPNAYNRILYQKSSYTDAAYLQFAPLLTLPRAAYAHSFPSACEDVFNGLCEFCILPIENTSEGTLHGFSRLIEQYGLKICATCEVSDHATDRTTQFALLRKSITPLITAPAKTRYFSFAIPLDDAVDLSQLLAAAKLLGLRTHRVDLIPSLSALGSASARITLRVDCEQPITFLLYLAMEAPYYVPLGLYSHL